MTSPDRSRQLPSLPVDHTTDHTTDDTPADAPGSSCGGCARAHDRRAFLTGVAAVIAALALDSAFSRSAQALPDREVRRLAPVGASPQEATYPLPATDGVSIDKKEGVIIARHAGVVYAFALSCPHQNTALRWNDGNGTFQCPRHKSKYQADGVFITGRATRAMDRFALHRAGDTIVVDLDHLYQQDDNATEWAGAKVAL